MSTAWHDEEARSLLSDGPPEGASVLRPVVPSWKTSACPSDDERRGQPATGLRVPLKVVRHGQLLPAAIGAPLRRWAIVLFLEGSSGRVREDLRLIFRRVPWFCDLPDWPRAFAQLRRHGLTVLITDQEALARQLFRDIPPGGHERIYARFYTPEGRPSW